MTKLNQLNTSKGPKTGEEIESKEPCEKVDSSSKSRRSSNASKKENALSVWPQIREQLESKTLAIFLDYDGTLTPIVSNPSEAVISEPMRNTVENLSNKFPTAIVTGRAINTIRGFICLENLYYAGSHGFDIRAPGNHSLKQVASSFRPSLEEFYEKTKKRLTSIAGSLVENNVFSISVHYRNVHADHVKQVEMIVDQELSKFSSQLVKKHGKMVFEVRPQIDWHKGHAVDWLLNCMFDEEKLKDVIPIYLGDDITDEDAFRCLKKYPQAVGVFVRPPSKDRDTDACFILESTQEVQSFLSLLVDLDSQKQ